MFLRVLRLLTVLVTVTGLLGVAAPAHADDAHRPAVNCNPPVQHPVELAAVFTGEAHAAVGHVPLVSVTVHCDYFGENVSGGGSATAEGPVVVLHGVGGLYFDLFETVCQSAEAVYADGHVATTPETCRPILQADPDLGPPPSDVTAPLLDCNFNRGPSLTETWVVEVAGVAAAGARVPLSTYVLCTISTSAGEASATATMPGGAASGANVVPLDNVSVDEKCAWMVVTYGVNDTVTTHWCQAVE